MSKTTASLKSLLGAAAGAAAITAATPAQADAELLTMRADGTITSVDLALQGGGVDVGDAFTLFFTVDTDTVDSNPGLASAGLYLDSIHSIVLDVPGYNLFLQGGDSFITDTSIIDEAFVRSQSADQPSPVADFNGHAFSSALISYLNGNPLSSDDLSDALFSLDFFNDKEAEFDFSGNKFSGHIERTSLVAIPEPAAVVGVISGLGMLLLGFRERLRHKKSNNES